MISAELAAGTDKRDSRGQHFNTGGTCKPNFALLFGHELTVVLENDLGGVACLKGGLGYVSCNGHAGAYEGVPETILREKKVGRASNIPNAIHSEICAYILSAVAHPH